MGAAKRAAAKKRDPRTFTARPAPKVGGRGRPRTMPALPFATTRLAGDRMAQVRAERDWTQGDLADRAGISRRDVSLYETSMRAALFPTVVRIADALGVSLDYLAGRSNDPKMH